jgi:hypothetical protein
MNSAIMKNMLNHFLVILLILCIAGCSRSCVDCEVHIRQSVVGLKDSQSLVVYDQDCTANSHTVTNISFETNRFNIKRERGDIFRADGVEFIEIEKISSDSVLVVYKSEGVTTRFLRIYKSEKRKNGIVFIYKDISDPLVPIPK